MRKRKELLIIILLMIILAASLLSGSVWAKEIKTGSKAKLDGGTIQYTTEMSLIESLTPSDPNSWTPVYGNLANGYTMVLSGTAGVMEYLDVAGINTIPDNGDYPFYLDPVRVPANFWDWWALQGVVAGASSWQSIMWEIINGRLPIFVLRVAGTDFDLLDGLAYAQAADPSLVIAPAQVDGNYPLHTYNFEGMVGTENVVVGITYTHEVTPSLRIDDVEPTVIVIDGCGYVDVTIHLENVVNLYAVDVKLTYDPTEVEIMDLVDPEALGINLEPMNELITAAYWVYNEASNGEIRYVATQTRDSTPATGSGNIAKIRLRAKALGESEISITEMTLSDRDGYLVGVPLTTPVVYPITTQFTADGGLDLGITRLNAGTVQLNWPAQTVDKVDTFTLHRSTLPYFTPDPTPDTGTIYQTITNEGTVATFDDPVLGNVVDNYFYTMQITCASGLESPYAWQVGKFEYTLYETNTTDFTWIGFVLENDGVYDSQTLANHVEDNLYSGQVTVNTISRWNANGQSNTTYNHTTGTSIFPVSVKYPYRVEIDITDPITTNNTVIWAQVGRLPEVTENTYTLYETNTTDFTWVLQPLDLVSITNTLQLADHIRANSIASIYVLAIGRWNGTGQSVTSILTPVGGTNYFDTRFGYPYRIESDIVTGTTVTWP